MPSDIPSTDQKAPQGKPRYQFQHHYVLRSALALAWYAVSFCAQMAFDQSDAHWVQRFVAVLVVAGPLAVVMFWVRAWQRRADEYQRHLTHKAISQAATGAIIAGVLGHWIGVWLFNILPVMALPAWATLMALVYYRHYVRAR